MDDHFQHLTLGNRILSVILDLKHAGKGRKAESKMYEDSFLVLLKTCSPFQILFPCLSALKAPLPAMKTQC